MKRVFPFSSFGIVTVSWSGRAVLSAYYDFADYHQEARWDTNPRVESLAALLALL